ncbi:restriction endonuclease subunit S [Treponema phagedenis]|uniref:restriction endonuclease subunit S n=1 Tax=Treponema phagedenis TaxID=162 RepID=UPI00197F63F7|nr:restriction endonuclease subunit S [Treponema phagedenis]
MNKRLSLNDVEWGEFNFTEIFSDIFIAKSSDSNKLQKGKVPFIGRSSINNGYQGDYDVEKEKVVKGNSITVSMVGEPKAFYQHYDFTCSQNILILQNDESLNRYNATFLCSIIDQYLIKKGYGYGYPVGLKRVIRNSLLLPSDENLKPNWQFMEDYIKQEQKIIAHKVIDYYEQKMLETAFDLVGLEDVEWKNFKLGSLFTFERKPSKGLNHLDTDKNRGISYLGATNKNNGVLEFVDPISNLVYRGNCIAFIRNGEGSMGYSVYKKENFMATQDISVGYNENLNQYNGMFITTVADRVRGKYNFGYKRNQSRLENEILTLPADKNGNPHWEYMSKFMQKLEVEKISNFLPYIYIYKVACSIEKTVYNITSSKWQEFWIEDICTIKSGQRLVKAQQQMGTIPFIGASDSDNGITAFISNINSSVDKNVLGVNYNGSVVHNFYHPYKCIFSDDVKRLHFKCTPAKNEATYLFLKQALLQQKGKYTYGYKFTGERMKRQKIILPITEQHLITTT